MLVSSNSGMKSMLSALSVATVFALLECSQGVQAQVYLQNPKGSNNRLNEATDTVTTANRLFISGNNARGGYNVGDRSAAAGAGNAYLTYAQMYNAEDAATAGQYDMQYIEGSRLQVQFMNQHGCGGDVTDASPVNCELILQYMCQTQPEGSAAVIAPAPYMMGSESLYNGRNTGKATLPTTLASVATTTAANTAAARGRHESEMYYYECSKRSRNLNLFTGSVTGQMGQYATSTRQNPTNVAASQGGMECNEERDYYPYWSPSPWKDMAVLTDHSTSTCVAGKFTYASQNNLKTFKCVPAAGAQGATYDAQLFPITEAACVAAQGSWTAFTHGMDAPDCLPAPWSSGNHLGNGVDGRPLAYDWIVPSMAKLITSGATVFQGATPDQKYLKCVMRIRYNVTLDERDPYQLSALNNTDTTILGATANPTVNIGTAATPINVAVHVSGKTLSTVYEDRSHTFTIASRPAAFPAGATIVNANVRGKRCNIVQCNPAVEYDYAPHDMVLQKNTYVHWQWTGSNTHANAAGAGTDGQDGSAGEGAANTDRQNVAQVLDMAGNYPIPLDKVVDNMWTRSKCFKPTGASLTATSNAAQDVGQANPAATECALWITTSGQVRSIAQANALAANAFQNQLDTAPASLIGGVIQQFTGVTKDTTFTYISTRNNNFTNRGQKGQLTVTVDPAIGDVLRS